MVLAMICRTGGALERAQQSAGHRSPKTTKLDRVTVQEIDHDEEPVGPRVAE